MLNFNFFTKSTHKHMWHSKMIIPILIVCFVHLDFQKVIHHILWAFSKQFKQLVPGCCHLYLWSNYQNQLTQWVEIVEIQMLFEFKSYFWPYFIIIDIITTEDFQNTIKLSINKYKPYDSTADVGYFFLVDFLFLLFLFLVAFLFFYFLSLFIILFFLPLSFFFYLLI